VIARRHDRDGQSLNRQSSLLRRPTGCSPRNRSFREEHPFALQTIQDSLATNRLLSRESAVACRPTGCSPRNPPSRGDQPVARHGIRRRVETNRLLATQSAVACRLTGCSPRNPPSRGDQPVGLRRILGRLESNGPTLLRVIVVRPRGLTELFHAARVRDHGWCSSCRRLLGRPEHFGGNAARAAGEFRYRVKRHIRPSVPKCAAFAASWVSFATLRRASLRAA